MEIREARPDEHEELGRGDEEGAGDGRGERQRPMRTVLKLAQGRGEIDPDLDLDTAVAMLVGPFTHRRMVQNAEITDEFVATVVPGGIAALHSTAPD